MALLRCALLLGGAHAALVTTSNFNVSTKLESLTDVLKVVFFDFDRTITTNSTDSFLAECDVNCVSYNTSLPACTCIDYVLGDFLVNNHSARVLADPGIFMNGNDRRDRLASTFALLRAKNIEVKVISTSWYSVKAASWAYFISKVLDVANLTQYIPMADIIALDDPGMNIPADKGSVMATYLANKTWNMHQGLLLDDSVGNINSSIGKIDWLQVIPRNGLTVDQLQYVEARADRTMAPTPASGAPTMATAPTPASIAPTMATAPTPASIAPTMATAPTSASIAPTMATAPTSASIAPTMATAPTSASIAPTMATAPTIVMAPTTAMSNTTVPPTTAMSNTTVPPTTAMSNMTNTTTRTMAPTTAASINAASEINVLVAMFATAAALFAA